MSVFSGIEKTIERGFQRWTEKLFGAADANELLVVHRRILEEVESKIETLTRGRRIFPYTHLTIALASPDANRRAVLETAFGERIESDIREALQSARCETPGGFGVSVRTVEEGPAFEIDYSSATTEPARKPAAPADSQPAAQPRLLVVKGKTSQAEYVLDKARINIGRLAELTDADQRVVRRNDVVFEEGADEANETVSRKHAHITRDAGEYRLCDDESEFGTRVFRDGRGIEVPAGNRRGEKLRVGDEIYLGRACLRFEM